ncbi:MAG: hypothetical protein NTV80_26865 [Verrucomicrobia bacterium]|nr:hypothetical protein [Verrucomicrobiota bacterium]
MKIASIRVIEFTDVADAQHRSQYVEVVSETGLIGLGGPLYAEQGYIIAKDLAPVLIGRDAMAGEALWDLMKLSDRHSRAGFYMMAISAVDIALWDLRGQHLGRPVYELLGGPVREKIPVYASMLGFDTQPDAARKTAREFYDRGFKAQKWFLKAGPQADSQSFQKNITLLRTLREELGADAELMVDCMWGWDAPYAVKFAKVVKDLDLKWIEEPVRSENLDGYEILKRDGGVPVAGGEHLYSRWEVKQYLDRKLLDYVQADPEWCGGITELVKICTLCEVHAVPVIPHGHHIWASLHVVASQPERVAPMCEFLFHWMPEKQYFQDSTITPENGFITLPKKPGIGFAIDASKVASRREIKPA